MELREVICRPHRRSTTSTREVPRVCVDLIFPESQTDLDVLLQLRHVRGSALPSDAYFGLRSMIGSSEAMVLETSSPLSLHHYWPLCTQLVPLSPTKALVFTDASAEVWTQVMDTTMRTDSMETSVRLKWKPSS